MRTLSATAMEPVCSQPRSEDALQVGQVGALVVVDEQQVDRAGAESVCRPARRGCLPAVTDGADHAGDAVVDPGVRPDPSGHFGVGRRQLDGEHLGVRCGPGDAQRAVAAVGAELERQLRVGATDGGVEQLTLLVADVDQHRLLDGELVDRCEHVIDVAAPGVGLDVGRAGGFPAVADLTGLDEARQPHAQGVRNDERRNGNRRFTLMDRQPRRADEPNEPHVARGSALSSASAPLNLPGCSPWPCVV